MSRPELKLGSHLARGVGALALFVVLVAVTLNASFGSPAGFPADASITAAIGYAMFNLDGGAVASEGFLVAFEIIDLVLVAALVGAVMLARRDVGGRIVGALRSGGED
ncbi:MAG: NADH-quinone oxidoreductase subunit J [Halobacteriales archaeon]|nr:NADH-quinone oxidoreductase subunit J [Halobacteriales archaeon]